MKFTSKKVASTLLVSLSVFLLSVSIFNLTTKKNSSTYLSHIVGQEYKDEVQCLAENIYYEAGNESFEGKSAVAQVTLNRVNSGKFKSTICGVVKQKDIINGLTVCQFSWFCDHIKSAMRNKYQWEESYIVAKKALSEPHIHDMLFQSNALYYHNNMVRPGWNLTRIGQIGNHIFYKEKNGKI